MFHLKTKPHLALRPARREAIVGEVLPSQTFTNQLNSVSLAALSPFTDKDANQFIEDIIGEEGTLKVAKEISRLNWFV